MRAMRLRQMAATMTIALAVAGCDQVDALLTEASDKGGTDVPEAARSGSDASDPEALRRRISNQSFN
jgi:hypothetical protein